MNFVPQRSYVPLNVARKRRLVELYQVEGYSLQSVADCYDVHPERIQYFAKRIKKGLPLFKETGRPPKLDTESVESILQQLRQTPTMSKLQIHQLVRQENKNTFARRYPHEALSATKQKISSLTVRRWTEKLLLLL
jgi:transposase